jgi:hypothetical protein
MLLHSMNFQTSYYQLNYMFIFKVIPLYSWVLFSIYCKSIFLLITMFKCLFHLYLIQLLKWLNLNLFCYMAFPPFLLSFVLSKYIWSISYKCPNRILAIPFSFFLLFTFLGIEPRTLQMLINCSTTELHPSLYFFLLRQGLTM